MVLQIGKIELKRIAVPLHDARRATRRQIELESIDGRTAPDGALHLALRGLVDAWPAYRLQLDGGPLPMLQQGAEPCRGRAPATVARHHAAGGRRGAVPRPR